jgi:hypothetical protein
MTTTAVPATRVKRPRVTLYVLRLFVTVHLLLALVQPVMAGLFLTGEVDAMDNAHSPIGSTLWLIAMFQVIPALLYWRPGGGRLYPLWFTLGLLFAEFLQLVLGNAQAMAMHITLGVLIITALLMLTFWCYGDRSKQGRRARA